jgi:hypothetical protein
MMHHSTELIEFYNIATDHKEIGTRNKPLEGFKISNINMFDVPWRYYV